MKIIQIILFVLASIAFLTQIGRHAHQVVYGTERSVLDRFETDFADRQKALEQKDDGVLLDNYREANEHIRALEKGVKHDALEDLRRENVEKYDLRDSLRTEIQEREQRRRQLRDIWIYSAFGILLIFVGAAVYRGGAIWAGFAVVVTGFSELEYWASPTFFGGAADAEFHTLLINKLILSLIALALLYAFWAIRNLPNHAPNPKASAITPAADAPVAPAGSRGAS
jgi:hypothetical protein